MKRFTIVFTLSSVMALSGCATTIGNKADISNVTFEIGKTDKSTVAQTLGLPADISQSEALGLEYWTYLAKPELTGIILPTQTGGATYITGETGDYEFGDAAVVYVFDRGGILVGVRELEHKK